MVASIPLKFKLSLNRTILPIEGTQTGTITLDKRRPRYSTLCRSPKLELHYQMQFSVIPRTTAFSFFFMGGVFLLHKMRSSYYIPHQQTRTTNRINIQHPFNSANMETRIPVTSIKQVFCPLQLLSTALLKNSSWFKHLWTCKHTQYHTLRKDSCFTIEICHHHNHHPLLTSPLHFSLRLVTDVLRFASRGPLIHRLKKSAQGNTLTKAKGLQYIHKY